MQTNRRLIIAILVGLLLILPACAIPGMATPTPKVKYVTWTPKPTDTTAPTDTPAPTDTATLPPPATDTPVPPPTEPPAPTVAATVSDENAIRVYYINLEEKGQFGCGEALWYLKTQRAKSGNVPEDVRYALSLILGYHNEKIGILHHPGWASSIGVNNVEQTADGGIVVNLSGTWTPTNDRCDGKRFIDQLRQTIRQFGVTNIQIFLNGSPIGDAISRK
jgi:hypothetical protein